MIERLRNHQHLALLAVLVRNQGRVVTYSILAKALGTDESDPDERNVWRVNVSKIRKLTGSHMVMSKSVSPHAFSVVEVDYANVDATRGKVKGEWKATEGFSLTYLPFIARAVIDALHEFPHLNATVGDGELIVHNYVNLAFAVDLNFDGLLAPVVHEADDLRFRVIHKGKVEADLPIKDLGDQAPEYDRPYTLRNGPAPLAETLLRAGVARLLVG